VLESELPGRHALRNRSEETIMRIRRAPVLPPLAGDALSDVIGREALDDLFSVTYEQLRRLASSVRRSDPSATISPTGLVNEAWLKLANSPAFKSASQLHFKRIAARAMRQILVEGIRRRRSAKRGGDEAFVVFDEAIDRGATTAREVLALDAALESLSRIEPRQALLVEARYFGGLDVAETAALLGVSEATVLRDWRAAKAWLALQISDTRTNY
jgi:RNA polymerase sigma factor (TIGR02999 family)